MSPLDPNLAGPASASDPEDTADFEDGLNPGTEAFEKAAFPLIAYEMRIRHDSPALDQMLGIDPDDPDELAAIALIAVRPLIEALTCPHREPAPSTPPRPAAGEPGEPGELARHIVEHLCQHVRDPLSPDDADLTRGVQDLLDQHLTTGPGS